jgi:hypothetical protein
MEPPSFKGQAHNTNLIGAAAPQEEIPLVTVGVVLVDQTVLIPRIDPEGLRLQTNEGQLSPVPTDQATDDYRGITREDCAA